MRYLPDPDYMGAYTMTVPESSGGAHWMTPLLLTPTSGYRTRLLGEHVLVDIVDYAPELWKLYSRITLIATDRESSTVESVSFSVDRNLVKMLRPGDVVNVTHELVDGLGFSIVRRDHLLCALGDVREVPLGGNVRARVPGDLLCEADKVMQRRDPTYEHFEEPVEFIIGDATRIFYRGRPTIKGYEIYMARGYGAGKPPCISVANVAICADAAAPLSALLLDKEPAQLTHWR